MCAVLTALLGIFGLSGYFSPVSAHEAYVLSHKDFSRGLHAPTLDTLTALAKPQNLELTIVLIVVVSLVLLLLFYLRYTKFGMKADLWLGRFSQFGLLVIRIALAAAFLYGASTNSIFGPELSLHNLPLFQVLPYIEYLIGGLLLVGLFTEVAAVLALILFAFAAYANGFYLLTYLNYLAEIAVLILFGSRFLSLDSLIFGELKRFSKLREYENTIIRIGYGAALLYAAIYIKVIHSEIPLEVVNQYHLNQFHWLFPHDPMLIVLGAAVVEIIIAIFIIFGFSTRFTNLVLMFYLTLSILFFKETVWPHYMLYGISISLLLSGSGELSLDHALKKFRVKNADMTVRSKK